MMIIRVATVVVCLALTGCSTNMSTVGAFSKSTQELAGQSIEMLNKYANQCRKRLEIIDHEKSILDHAEIYWKNAKSNLKKSSESLSAIAQARDSLSPYEAGLNKTCPEQQSKLVAIRSIGEALQNYGTAIQALAADEFVAYNPKLDQIPTSLATLPNSNGKPLLDDAQQGAVKGLIKLVYDISIHSYRQKQLNEAMGDAQRTQLVGVSNTLSELASSYRDGLKKEDLELQNFSSDLGRLLITGVLPEPLSVTEVKNQLDRERSDINKRIDVLIAYDAALKEFIHGFDAAEKTIHEKSTKEIAKEVINFGKSVYKVQTDLEKAF